MWYDNNIQSVVKIVKIVLNYIRTIRRKSMFWLILNYVVYIYIYIYIYIYEDKDDSTYKCSVLNEM